MKIKMIEKYNKPILFYGLSLFIPWVLWFAAAYISRLAVSNRYLAIMQGILGILGLVAPVFVAAYLFLSDRELLSDLKTRIFRMKGFNPLYTAFSVLLIFVSIIMAQLTSVLFGHSIDQFFISGHPKFTSVLFSPWFILIFAPVVEELAWHSYGTDTLLRKFKLFTSSIVFAIYWVFWHLPLSFIEGYYHSNIVEEGWLYSLNFILSLFVFVILMNWLYLKTNRNILITILFHLSANISNELFATHPDSKVIQTGILLIVSIVVLFKERKMFFGKEFLA
ncbi:CPBP family intramembrane glutamic endopeptidase [Maribellus maritimus]|uniref:CPBP family intramembrane glutamic endopeptidase n=1 Tax=Maribellus maritimus TaxID=2870838 RepID=UPI001EEA430B|nr:CPBP family intramembrane glutamic endopeptidase [Maribellus maritimus]MCG6191135.1 CPBP family intramembrane metalloprotease [Maribellus maritimus]